jgi:hypothetical protein
MVPHAARLPHCGTPMLHGSSAPGPESCQCAMGHRDIGYAKGAGAWIPCRGLIRINPIHSGCE